MLCFLCILFLPIWFLDCSLIGAVGFLKRWWPFLKDMSCHHPSAHSMRTLPAPWSLPSFSELSVSIFLGVLGYTSSETASTPIWKLLPRRIGKGQRDIQCHIPAMLFVLLLKWCSKFELALCRLGSWRAPHSFSIFLGVSRKKPLTRLLAALVSGMVLSSAEAASSSTSNGAWMLWFALQSTLQPGFCILVDTAHAVKTNTLENVEFLFSMDVRRGKKKGDVKISSIKNPRCM